MIKKLTKHGNSYAIIIDKPILELLKLSPTATVEITTDGTAITITPVQRTKAITRRVVSNTKKQKNLDELVKRYAPALKKLAQKKN